MVSNDNYDDNNNNAESSDSLVMTSNGDCGLSSHGLANGRLAMGGNVGNFYTTTTTTLDSLHSASFASMSIRLKNQPRKANGLINGELLNGYRPNTTCLSDDSESHSQIPSQLPNDITNGVTEQPTNDQQRFSQTDATPTKASQSCQKNVCIENPDRPHWFIIWTCYFSFFVLISFGYFRDFLQKIFRSWIVFEGQRSCQENNREGFTPLYKSWQHFFSEHIYRRASDVFAQPITGNPGGVVKVLERISHDYNRSFELTGKTVDCINLASYDYLGFSQLSSQNVLTVQNTIRKYGVGIAPTHELGITDKQYEMEQKFARFLGVEDCVVFGMGFATNSTNIPVLVGPGAKNCLVISDRYNHASVRTGIYLSGATFRQFAHNDMNHLERIIRAAILEGNPKNGGRKWDKIIIIVEGVYSMEGTIVDLPRLMELKKRYKCYLYIDEAHSIGAVGPNGRGVCDYFNCDPTEVDLLMGTMTKSFAAAGGYIAGKRHVLEYIRANTHSNYAGSMAAPIAQQIINTLDVLLQEGPQSEGKRRYQALRDNTHYMRARLKQLGFIIVGNIDSPVIPVMVYIPAKVLSIVRVAIQNGLALVCAGYPATALTACRIRLCLTAGHSRETLDRAVQLLSMLGDMHAIKYAK